MLLNKCALVRTRVSKAEESQLRSLHEVQTFFFRLYVDSFLLGIRTMLSLAFLHFLRVLNDSANEVISVLDVLKNLILKLDAVVFQNLFYVYQWAL